MFERTQHQKFTTKGDLLIQLYSLSSGKGKQGKTNQVNPVNPV